MATFATMVRKQRIKSCWTKSKQNEKHMKNVKTTKHGKIIIKMRDGDIEAPKHMTREEVLELLKPFPVGTSNRTKLIREAVQLEKRKHA